MNRVCSVQERTRKKKSVLAPKSICYLHISLTHYYPLHFTCLSFAMRMIWWTHVIYATVDCWWCRCCHCTLFHNIMMIRSSEFKSWIFLFSSFLFFTFEQFPFFIFSANTTHINRIIKFTSSTQQSSSSPSSFSSSRRIHHMFVNQIICATETVYSISSCRFWYSCKWKIIFFHVAIEIDEKQRRNFGKWKIQCVKVSIKYQDTKHHLHGKFDLYRRERNIAKHHSLLSVRLHSRPHRFYLWCKKEVVLMRFPLCVWINQNISEIRAKIDN